MRQYEITYFSYNSEYYAKRLTALVIEPDTLGPETGVMLFSHGWGGTPSSLKTSFNRPL